MRPNRFSQAKKRTAMRIEHIPAARLLHHVLFYVLWRLRSRMDKQHRPVQAFRVAVCAARSLNAVGQSRVTLSLR